MALEMRAVGDREVVGTRHFAAPPELVYRAHVEPELVKRWLVGSEDWQMTVCDINARPSGSFRYDWVNADGNTMSIQGEFVELTPYSRIVHIERMFFPDATPDYRVETRFDPDGAGTLLTIRMTFASAEARETMLSTGMAEGMEQTYARLDQAVLA